MRMRSVYIDLQNGRLVKSFVTVISKLQGAFELVSDRTVLDAKSILGIYSLNLSVPLLLRIELDTKANMEILKDFILT